MQELCRSSSDGLLHVMLEDSLLDVGDGEPWVETLRACLGAVHDGVAAVQLHAADVRFMYVGMYLRTHTNTYMII
jgi:hypothetical protein